MVSDLMHEDRRSWNVSLICSLFNSRDREAILKVLLTSGVRPDVRVWHYTSDGQFSIKSAYHL